MDGSERNMDCLWFLADVHLAVIVGGVRIGIWSELLQESAGRWAPGVRVERSGAAVDITSSMLAFGGATDIAILILPEEVSRTNLFHFLGIGFDFSGVTLLAILFIDGDVNVAAEAVDYGNIN
jgi:hypothetical protein